MGVGLLLYIFLGFRYKFQTCEEARGTGGLKTTQGILSTGVLNPAKLTESWVGFQGVGYSFLDPCPVYSFRISRRWLSFFILQLPILNPSYSRANPSPTSPHILAGRNRSLDLQACASFPRRRPNFFPAAPDSERSPRLFLYFLLLIQVQHEPEPPPRLGSTNLNLKPSGMLKKRNPNVTFFSMRR